MGKENFKEKHRLGRNHNNKKFNEEYNEEFEEDDFEDYDDEIEYDDQEYEKESEHDEEFSDDIDDDIFEEDDDLYDEKDHYEEDYSDQEEDQNRERRFMKEDSRNKNSGNRNPGNRNSEDRNFENRNSGNRYKRNSNTRNNIRNKKKKRKEAKNRLVSFLVAVVLILVIGGIAFGGSISKIKNSGEEMGLRSILAILYPDKYAYSTEEADLNAYFGLTAADDVAIILQDEKYEDNAKYSDGEVYFALTTIQKIFTNRFYYNSEEQMLIYSKASELITVPLNAEQGYYVSSDINSLGELTATDYAPAKCDSEGNLYVAADFIRLFVNYEYNFYPDPNRVQVNIKWEETKVAEVINKTNVRYQGGIKSDILRAMEKGEQVTVLEVMENWSKIKTSDGFIGYVENRNLGDITQMIPAAVTDAYVPELDYDMGQEGNKITMVFHQMFDVDDGTRFNELYASTSGIDVVSPTWFSVNASDGTFISYSSAAYVQNAHEKGLKVWASVEDVNYDVDEYALFSSTSNRRNLINNLVSSTIATGADGINVDFEKVGSEAGPHFVQFLRELSIQAHQNGLLLSVDDYPKNEGNLYYNYREQGRVADFVVLMCYGEHWETSEPGSVASMSFTEQSISDMISAGVSSSKLICAVPFYTICYRTEGTTTSSEAMGMVAASQWLTAHGVSATMNEETNQNYASVQDGTATYQIWMEDDTSVQTRMQIMKNYNLAGVAAWKLGLESSSVWPIINSYWE